MTLHLDTSTIIFSCIFLFAAGFLIGLCCAFATQIPKLRVRKKHHFPKDYQTYNVRDVDVTSEYYRSVNKEKSGS